MKTGSVWKTPEKRSTDAPAAAAPGESPSARSATQKRRTRNARFASARTVGDATKSSGERGQKTAAFGSAAKARPFESQSFQAGNPSDQRRGRSARHGVKKNPASRKERVPPARKPANRTAKRPKSAPRASAEAFGRKRRPVGVV